MKGIKNLILISVLLVGAFAVYFHTVQSQEPTLPVIQVEYDDPTLPPVNPPLEFSMSIKVYNVSYLTDWEFYLRWNPFIVRFINITEGNWNATWNGMTPGRTDFHWYLSSLSEYVQVSSGLWERDKYVNDTGEGKTLAVIWFECYDTGDQFYFDLYGTSLWKEGGSLVPIDHTAKDALWYTELPVVRFFFTPEKPDLNQEVVFNASESYAQPGHTITDFTWHFGDGTPPYSSGTEPNATHTYTNYGTFEVTVTVTDDANNAWYKKMTLKIWRDIASIDFWPCPWWHLYILEYEPYMETSILPGEWLFKGEALYITISWQNVGTLTTTYNVTGVWRDVSTGAEYEITGYTYGYGPFPILNLVRGPDAKCRATYLMDTDGGWDGTAVMAPGNRTYVGILKVSGIDDQNPANDEYEYTVAFFLRIMGDADASGRADGGDLAILCAAWYQNYDWKPPFPDQYPNFSREMGDKRVDGGDLAILGLNWFATS
jgi:hypothetical protein